MSHEQVGRDLRQELPCGGTAHFDKNASGTGMVCDTCFRTVRSFDMPRECREALDRERKQNHAGRVLAQLSGAPKAPKRAQI